MSWHFSRALEAEMSEGADLYYEDGSVRIFRGDCRAVLPHLDEVDHVITDPPYSAVTHKGARTNNGGDPREFIGFSATHAEALREVLQLVRCRRWVVFTLDWRHALALEERPPRGLRWVRLGIWVKPNGAPQFTGDRPGTGWEAVAILHAAGGRMRWNGGGRRAVWTHNVEVGGHPTQKPLGLVREWIQSFTEPGELIVDPFCGSGTTLRAAKDLGRRAIGIEREEKWCELAACRLRQEVLPLTEGEGGVGDA